VGIYVKLGMYAGLDDTKSRRVPPYDPRSLAGSDVHRPIITGIPQVVHPMGPVIFTSIDVLVRCCLVIHRFYYRARNHIA
jgi:hypothetical protein